MFLHVLNGHATKTVHDFSPQNMANTIWALATLGIESQASMRQSPLTACSGNDCHAEL